MQNLAIKQQIQSNIKILINFLVPIQRGNVICVARTVPLWQLGQ